MFSKQKFALSALAEKTAAVLPPSPRVLALRRRLFLARLERENPSIYHVERAKDIGVKVGSNCKFFSSHFGPEPFLVEIGDNCIISGDVHFITHDGSVHIFDWGSNISGTFGKIVVGNNCFFGLGVIVTRNTVIGDNCVIGCGAVIRGQIPADSVVVGNPGKVVFKTSVMEKILRSDKGTIFAEFPTRAARNEHLKKHFNVLEGSQEP